jgi:hypothetical protein
MNMSYVAELKNEKRGKSVITWSAIYLATSWLGIVSLLLNPNSDALKISDLLVIPLFVAMPTAFILTWRWLRSLIISAKLIDPSAIGYRKGWAFWGWVTPIASWWIPRRLLDRSHGLFTTYSGVENTLRLGVWWGLFVAAGIIDYLSLRASLAGNADGVVVYLDIVSAILLTIAFPKWKRVVQTVSDSQRKAISKF